MQNMRKLTKGICINDADQCTLATYVEYAVDRACQALLTVHRSGITPHLGNEVMKVYRLAS